MNNEKKIIDAINVLINEIDVDEDSQRKQQPTPVFLPGESHGPKSLAGCSPWGC